MSATRRCLICGQDSQWELLLDFATDFVFCKTCDRKIREEYNGLIGKKNMAKWLRAIANVMENYLNMKED